MPIPKNRQVKYVLNVFEALSKEPLLINWNRFYAQSLTWTWIGEKPLGYNYKD